jgi:acyl dehydratase
MSLNLNRRKFLKIGSVALASPLVMKGIGLVSPNTAAAKAKGVTAAYNRAIDRMFEDTKKRFAAVGGWAPMRGPAKVTAEELIRHASSIVSYNPFWLDESYAAATRWGGLIAFPMFSAGGQNYTTVPSETPECGFDRQLWPGQDWEFFQPVRADDSLRVWMRKPRIEEQVGVDRDGIRAFILVEGDFDDINQRNEIVSTMKNYTVRIFFPDGPPGPPYIWERYGFTREEILFLDRMARSEEVRGSEIRYWEDVNVGDKLNPVVIPPTNMTDIASRGAGAATAVGGSGGLGGIGAGRGNEGGTRERPVIHRLLKDEGKIDDTEFIKYSETGLYYKSAGGAGRHWDDILARAEGEPGAFLWGVMSVHSMLRCVTNWMGDDAFMRKWNWRHITRTLVGDASYAQGKVTNKRMENGEYLVDIFVYQTDMRGFIVDCAVSTVALKSKTQPYPNVKKIVNY